MWIESQGEYNCMINTYNIKGISQSESSNGFGIYADEYKLGEYKSKEIRNKVLSNLKSLIIENKILSYTVPEEYEADEDY